MNIALDARWIFEEISGIGAYTRELIKNLTQLDRKNSYTLFFNNSSLLQRTAAEINLDSAPNFSTSLLPYSLFSPVNQLLLPALLKKMSIDIFHSTNYMIPLLAFPKNRTGKIKCVTTIHDVIPMIFPHHAPKSKKTRFFPLYKRLMLEVGMRSNIIIADSNASRKDIITHLHIPESKSDKIRTIYCGVAERFQPPQSPTRDQKVKTVLYVGRSDPYKNVTGLITAFAKAKKMIPVPVKLVIAGPQDSRYPEAMQTAGKLGVAQSIEWKGYLPDNELVAIYQQADLLAHPSAYEGFGLQIVEAMSCGTPVLCSNAASLPEVAGNAAIMVDHKDTDQFAAQMVNILTNPELSREMTEKGLLQAKKFTWARTAQETLKIYEQLS